MADRLDVAARLAEGRVAVEHTQSYVQACHALGYQHPDLTAHPAQIREWYASEDGLDLRALDRDCAELRVAAMLVAEALRMQRDQVAELAVAWTGPGGDAAVALLQRHCDTANTVATEVRAAAQRCESLRDNLWYLVDSKVATAIAVDDRTQAQRGAWLSAAAVATAGVGDRQSADDVLRQQVMPYVDNDIRNDWLTAMRSASDGVQTSYAMVTDRMAGAPTASFEFPNGLWEFPNGLREFPDDLGPGYPPVQPPPPAAAIGMAPAAPGPPLDPAPTLTTAAPVAAAPAPAVPAPAPAADWGTALGDASAMPAGDLGGGLGGGGGLVGLAGRIVDAVGGLLGSAADELGSTDPFGDGDAVDEDPFHGEAARHAEDTDDKPESDKPEPAEQAQPVEAPTPAGPPPNEAPAPGAAPAGAPEPVATPAAQPTPAAPAASDASTPCQIAAEQLPQAGQ